MHLERLYQEYKGRADFFFVYIEEAHTQLPVVVSEGGATRTMTFPETHSKEELMRRSRLLRQTKKLSMPALVSADHAALDRTYAPWPTRWMVIGPKGNIEFNVGLEKEVAGSTTKIYLNAAKIDAWMHDYFAKS